MGCGFAGEALVNFVFPVVIFDLAKPTYGEVGAPIASSAPPLIWSVIEFALFSLRTAECFLHFPRDSLEPACSVS